ncbi:MAG: AAC(3) family N-acetyltransferase [Tannerella sp.]|jgi:aminoglycoside 3-N-acetyltransferase|nr:AAC(3) family N-acetyltransferase [Tannerella sp.]
MDIKKIIYKLLPKDKAKEIRYKYRIIRQKLYKPISEEMFRKILTGKFGIKTGDTLFIHSSIDFLNIDFSPLQLLNILMDVTGKEGTLLFPGWHFNYRAEDYLLDENNIFNIKRSPTVLGLLPELARRLPDAQRSIHPINSIIAIGKNAKEIISGHEQSIYPCGETSPYYKMLKYNAKIIGIGVNSNFLAFVHCPEDMMKENFPVQTRTNQSFIGKVKLSTSEIMEVKTLAAHKNIQKRNIPAFIKRYIPKDIFSEYNIRGSNFFVADANNLFKKMVELAKQNKTIYNS